MNSFFAFSSRDFDEFQFCEIDATRGCTINCLLIDLLWQGCGVGRGQEVRGADEVKGQRFISILSYVT